MKRLETPLLWFMAILVVAAMLSALPLLRFNRPVGLWVFGFFACITGPVIFSEVQDMLKERKVGDSLAMLIVMALVLLLGIYMLCAPSPT